MTNWLLCVAAIFSITMGNVMLASLFHLGWLASMIYGAEKQHARKLGDEIKT